MTIEQRIKRLENLVGVRESSHVPGTRELGILKDVVIAEHNYPTCPGCKNEIDEEVCWCGDEIKKHTAHDGHNPVPMGCTCGYVCAGVDYAQGITPEA